MSDESDITKIKNSISEWLESSKEKPLVIEEYSKEPITILSDRMYKDLLSEIKELQSSLFTISRDLSSQLNSIDKRDEILIKEFNALGQMYRNDWSTFDGRVLKSEISIITDYIANYKKDLNLTYFSDLLKDQEEDY